MICWPPRTTVMRHCRWTASGDLSRSLVLRDLLIVDREDDVALLEAELCASDAVGDIDHDNALGEGVEPQFVGERRRNVGDLRALERRARGRCTISSRGGSGAVSARTSSLTVLAAAHARRSARCRRADLVAKR